MINVVHNHVESHADTIRVLQARTNLRNQMKEPLCHRPKAYLQELAALPEQLRPLFGTYRSVKSALRKLTLKSYPKCGDFTELDRLLTQNAVIKEKFGTVDGKQFYHRYFNDGINDAVLFLNSAAIEEATICDMILVDGTFRARPMKCAQILVIFRLIAGAVSYLALQ